MRISDWSSDVCSSDLGEHLQPLLNLLRDRLLESPVIHCDETRVQVLKEPDRDPTSQSWMWVQASGPPDRNVVLFDYKSSRAQEENGSAQLRDRVWQKGEHPGVAKPLKKKTTST